MHLPTSYVSPANTDNPLKMTARIWTRYRADLIIGFLSGPVSDTCLSDFARPAAVLCMVLFAIFIPTAETCAGNNPTFRLDSENHFRDYTVRLYSEESGSGAGRLEIFRKGKRVFRIREGGTFEIAETVIDRKGHRRPVPLIGKDINGDGTPDLVICEYSGGAHCCFDYHIFEMGRRFRETAFFDMKDSQLSFEDLDGDGKLEISGHDATFAYWHTCFAESPMPEIVLQYDGTRYAIAPGLMHRSAPSSRTLQEEIRKIRAGKGWEKGIDDYPPALWRVMLDLIYTGHADMAWNFFDKAWPENIRGKEAFLREFRSTLKSSPFWPGIRELNKGMI